MQGLSGAVQYTVSISYSKKLADWTTGLQMWIFKALRLVHYITMLQVTSYLLVTCSCHV